MWKRLNRKRLNLMKENAKWAFLLFIGWPLTSSLSSACIFGHLEIKTNYPCGYRRPENILHLLPRPACSLLPTFLRWLQPVKSTESLWISWQGLRRLLTCRVRCRLFTRRWRPFSQPPWPPLKAPFYGSLMVKAGPTRCAAVKKRLVPGSRQLKS